MDWRQQYSIIESDSNFEIYKVLNEYHLKTNDKDFDLVLNKEEDYFQNIKDKHFQENIELFKQLFDNIYFMYKFIIRPSNETLESYFVHYIDMYFNSEEHKNMLKTLLKKASDKLLKLNLAITSYPLKIKYEKKNKYIKQIIKKIFKKDYQENVYYQNEEAVLKFDNFNKIIEEENED